MVNYANISPTQIFVLGFLIVGAYIIFFGSSLYHSFIMESDKKENSPFTKICCNDTSQTILLIANDSKSDIQPFLSIEKVSATFGIIVAGVVGYYFGQRQSESSDKRAADAMEELKAERSRLEEELENRRNADERKEVDALTKMLDELEENSDILEDMTTPDKDINEK